MHSFSTLARTFALGALPTLEGRQADPDQETEDYDSLKALDAMKRLKQLKTLRAPN